MSFLYDECSLCELKERTDLEGFCCGDRDLDDFFTNYVQILCQICPDTLPNMSRYFAIYLHIVWQVSLDAWREHTETPFWESAFTRMGLLLFT